MSKNNMEWLKTTLNNKVVCPQCHFSHQLGDADFGYFNREIRSHLLADVMRVLKDTKAINHAGCSVNGKSHGESCVAQTKVKAKLEQAFNELLGGDKNG